MLSEVVDTPYVDTGAQDLILDQNDLVGFRGRAGTVRLLTSEQVRERLRFGHVRHIYWLVQQGHLPFRKFGRELVFLEHDIADFRARRGR